MGDGEDKNLRVGQILRAKELRQEHVETMQALANLKLPSAPVYWQLIEPVLRNDRLSPTAVRLAFLCILSANREGEVTRSYEQLEKTLNTEERTLFKALAQLEAHGYIERLQIKPRGRAHVYLRARNLLDAARQMPEPEQP